MPDVYPFAAIVGQERMKRALLLNAVNPRIGGVLIRGERGTAKSTAARALAALLPDVEVVAECRFGCDPHQPTQWCTECSESGSNNGQLPGILRPTSFIDLPVSATEDRVVGTLENIHMTGASRKDLARLLQHVLIPTSSIDRSD